MYYYRLGQFVCNIFLEKKNSQPIIKMVTNLLSDKEPTIYFHNSDKKFTFAVEESTFSLNILFDHNEILTHENNLKNLFLIIKSFTDQKDALLWGVYTTFENSDKESNKAHFLSNIKLEKLRRLDFIDFCLFFEKQYDYD